MKPFKIYNKKTGELIEVIGRIDENYLVIDEKLNFHYLYAESMVENYKFVEWLEREE